VTALEGGRRRGRIELYAAGFLLLLASAYVLVRGNLESSLRFVWLSMGLSSVAALAAVMSVLLPARTPGEALPNARSETPSDDE
jgi:hypothetical protein